MVVRTEYQSLQIGQARELGVDLKRSPDDLTHRGGKGCADSALDLRRCRVVGGRPSSAFVGSRSDPTE